MKTEFNELFDSYKELNNDEKQIAIIEFLKENIKMMQALNKQINNDLPTADISNISKVESSEYLDMIYQLIHMMTEQVEMYTEKISNEYYDEV